MPQRFIPEAVPRVLPGGSAKAHVSPLRIAPVSWEIRRKREMSKWLLRNRKWIHAQNQILLNKRKAAKALNGISTFVLGNKQRDSFLKNVIIIIIAT